MPLFARKKNGLFAPIGPEDYALRRYGEDATTEFWREEQQRQLPSSLRRFLPKATMTKDGDALGFESINARKKECAWKSQPVTLLKVPEADTRNFAAAYRNFKLDIPKECNPDARKFREEFTLPDPSKMPECYRICREGWFMPKKRLVVLWGIAGQSEHGAAPEAVEEWLVGQADKHYRFKRWLMALLWLLLLLLLLGIILMLPLGDGRRVWDVVSAVVPVKTGDPLGAGGKPDGTTAEKNPDGTTIEKKSDGTTVEKNPDGTTIEKKPDGTTIEKKSDGTTVEKKPDGTTIEKNPDGTTVEKKPDGTTVEKKSDGTTVEKKPDGTTVEKNPDGTTVEKKPDGTTVEKKSDGTTVVSAPALSAQKLSINPDKTIQTQITATCGDTPISSVAWAVDGKQVEGAIGVTLVIPLAEGKHQVAATITLKDGRTCSTGKKTVEVKVEVTETVKGGVELK